MAYVVDRSGPVAHSFVVVILGSVDASGHRDLVAVGALLPFVLRAIAAEPVCLAALSL